MLGSKVERKVSTTLFSEWVRDWKSRPIAAGPIISKVRRLGDRQYYGIMCTIIRGAFPPCLDAQLDTSRLHIRAHSSSVHLGIFLELGKQSPGLLQH
jgi:hypothetical protein